MFKIHIVGVMFCQINIVKPLKVIDSRKNETKSNQNFLPKLFISA